jgi:hypothetical protein
LVLGPGEVPVEDAADRVAGDVLGDGTDHDPVTADRRRFNTPSVP